MRAFRFLLHCFRLRTAQFTDIRQGYFNETETITLATYLTTRKSMGEGNT